MRVCWVVSSALVAACVGTAGYEGLEPPDEEPAPDDREPASSPTSPGLRPRVVVSVPATDPVEEPSEDRQRNAGVYAIWNGRRDFIDEYPWVTGGQAIVTWGQIQSGFDGEHGTFDWTALDSQMDRFAALGKPFTVQLNAERQRPDWIWDWVGHCTPDYQPRSGAAAEDVPQYWDPFFLDALQRELVHELAGHLGSYEHRDSILLVRSSPNAIGTEHLDPPDPTSCAAPRRRDAAAVPAFTAGAKRAYQEGIARLYHEELSAVGIAVALRAGSSGVDELLDPANTWIFATGTEADSPVVLQSSQGDVWAIERLRESFRTQAYWEPFKGSADGCPRSCRYAHPASWNWWRLLLELHKGVAYVAVYGDDLVRAESDPEYRAAFDWVTTYAGWLDHPRASPGAWLALRGGDAGGDPQLRDPEVSYSMHMTQLDPEATTRGVESDAGHRMIGDDGQRFGRTARIVPAGAGAFFALDDDFLGGLAGEGEDVAGCRVVVTFLDGSGDLRVEWSGSPASVRTVGAAQDPRWRTAYRDVACSGFASHPHALERGADLTVSAIGGDVTLHMIELEVLSRPRATTLPEDAIELIE